MKKFLNNKYLNILGIIIAIIAIFIALHSTPSLSIRTKLLFDGYFLEFFKGDIVFNEFQHNLDKDILEKDNSKIYTFTGTNATYREGFLINNFKVKKVGFLYFADSYGEA
ncbi:hypothetical protein ACED96_15205 [Clostridium thermobutyricum]|uniref:Uncharacterized protein n=1 Tax=Clostridium thermobutyricum TaxID=29372 RepID=N9W9C5_9CLOT|nr:hypothetical protein [Clostridium thermobutyricum]ENY99499.1 hypothetical protein HMPREF1092_03172 [Clostridium thermobutyricum]